MAFFYNLEEFENNKMSRNIYVYINLLLFVLAILYYWTP